MPTLSDLERFHDGPIPAHLRRAATLREEPVSAEAEARRLSSWLFAQVKHELRRAKSLAIQVEWQQDKYLRRFLRSHRLSARLAARKYLTRWHAARKAERDALPMAAE